MDSFFILEKMVEWKKQEMEQFYYHNLFASKKDGYWFRFLQAWKIQKPKAASCRCNCC